MILHYHKGKTIFYFVLCLLFTAALTGGMIFLFFNSEMNEKMVVALSFLILGNLLMYWTIYYLFLALIEKWCVKIENDGLHFSRSLAGFKLEYDQIEEARMFYQGGGYKQIGIKITNRKTWFKSLGFYQKFWVLMCRLFTRYDHIIPGYMISESPEETAALITELSGTYEN